MPTYDYVCRACAHHFEEFQNMTAATLQRCPKCKKNKLERLIGAGAGVIFKGSGFYQTDYKGAPRDGVGSGSGDTKGGNTKGGDTKGGDAKGGDTKGGDAKGGDAKGGDAKGGDTKGGCMPSCGTPAAPSGCAKKKT